MDYNILLAIVTLVGAITGFIFLATVLFRVTEKTGRDEQRNSFVQQRNLTPCFNDCMTKMSGDPHRAATCDTLCKSQV